MKGKPWYEAYAKVFKVNQTTLEVQVDINIRSAKAFSRAQALPSREPDFYQD